MQINSEKMKKFYDELTLRMDQVRAHIRKPLTLAEKILFSHAVNLQNFHKQSFEDSTSTIEYFPQIKLVRCLSFQN